MKIARKFTTPGQDAYADLDFIMTQSEIRNPDGTVVFKLDECEVPGGWSQVASDVIAQKYFRKAGVPAASKRVREKGVPEFLWRSAPMKRRWPSCPKTRVSAVKPRPSRCLTVWPGPGPIGAGRAAISPPRKTPSLFR